MAAWFLYAYGDPNTPVNIFAIDPVPGPGDWYSMFTRLPPNVANYVAVYAFDHSIQPADRPFASVAPRPNAKMINSTQACTLRSGSWKKIANYYQLQDPLAPSSNAQPNNYQLYVIRGRHSTISGNATADGQSDASKVS